MLKKALVSLVALLAVFFLLVSLRPEDYRTERSQVMQAKAATVFPYLNDMNLYKKWSPFVLMDPSQKMTVSGAPAGTGAKYAWESEQNGSGEMIITENIPSEKVTLDLHFTKPLDSVSNVQYLLKPEGAGVKVTWLITGKNNFIAKMMGMFMDQDAFLGKIFAEGLLNLKKLAEAEEKAQPAAAPAPN